MAVHGYITHAAYNRRYTVLLFSCYLVAFQIIAAFALTWYLLMADHEHTILSDPAGYALRYALPVAAFTAVCFQWLYRGHARSVMRKLDIRLVDRNQEPRFFAIAEEQCTALGVRFPRFGIIEAREPNALTVGDGPDHGLIAVTRGLLDSLDDDELAAVLAHEASHIRQGDTKALAANHALMRTAVILQTHNILRLEHWKHLVVTLLWPATFPLLLVSGAFTMASMRLARFARRGIRLSRDHIADGEAARATHFPDALISALKKVGGRGRFQGAERAEDLLFDGQADQAGGSHPAIVDRIATITKLSGELLDSKRSRRDTRVHGAGAAFGRRGVSAAAPAQMATANGSFGRRASAPVGRPVGTRPEAPPAKSSLDMLIMLLTDWNGYWRHTSVLIDHMEWREDDKRNWLGLTPNMVIPTIAASVAVCLLSWPSDGRIETFLHKVGPSSIVDVARQVNGGPFCEGPGYPPGGAKCGVSSDLQPSGFR